MNNQYLYACGWHDKNAAEIALKVLVVDDDRTLRESLRAALATYGFSVVSCENATEALLHAMLEEFLFIVTDYSMPGMNGLELTKRLREQFPFTIIIGMSGNDVGEEFLRIGANDFLQKPFAVHTLAMMIDGGDILA